MQPYTIIVGHGPSLLGARRGAEIDTYENIVRMKHFSRFHNEADYGNRVDYVCCSTEAASPTLANHIKPKSYWLYPKKGVYSQHVHKLYEKLDYKVYLKESNYWNELFRERSGYDPTVDKVKGRNVSTGFAAIFLAGHVLGKDIKLIGFDTLGDPKIKYESTFNPGTHHDNFHDWSIEHMMLGLVENKYGIKVEFI